MTTYLLHPSPSIRQAEMEACSRGFPVVWSPAVPTLTLEEAFGKPVNPKSYLVLLLCPRMPQALRHFGEIVVVILTCIKLVGL